MYLEKVLDTTNDSSPQGICAKLRQYVGDLRARRHEADYDPPLASRKVAGRCFGKAQRFLDAAMNELQRVEEGP